MKTKLLLLITICLMAFGVNAQINVVSITGEAVGGWGDGFDFDMTSTDGVHWTYTGLVVNTANSPTGTEGGLKFRANNAWTINWGSLAFPTGTGTQDGQNIQCIAGTYDVEFNSDTGEYNFLGGTPLPTVKLIGTAVSDPAGITFAATGVDTFRATNVTLLDGNGQFDIDGTIFGETTFPTGTLTGAADNIPVVAGVYSLITLNITSGEYAFTLAPLIPPVSIVGDGVGGWPPFPAEDPNQLTSADGTNYKIEKLACVVGPAKFRQDNAWTINWGDTAFPTGTGTQGGSDIPIATAGTYDVTFNRSTGEYNFFFPSISIVGDAVGGWPPFTGDDPNQLTTTDGVTYTISNLAVVAGPAKFRQANAWDINWGSDAFPTGTGTQGGANITVTTDGTFDVSFNRVTGEYNFTPSLATTTFNSKNFKVSPNPTKNVWNFVSAKQAIESIQIVDVLGKTVMTINPKEMNVTVDATSLTSGMYFAKIATANATETAKLIKN